MTDQLAALHTAILDAITITTALPASRENSIIKTKLQEAMMWHQESLQQLKIIRERAGHVVNARPSER